MALVAVEGRLAYGLVRLGDDRAVREFIEKPSQDEIDSDLINAGACILERSILDSMAAPGTNISIERDVFPTLVGNGLYGYPGDGYWLDIGTPARYLQGTFDILEGNVSTPVGGLIAKAGGALADGAEVKGRVVAPRFSGAARASRSRRSSVGASCWARASRSRPAHTSRAR